MSASGSRPNPYDLVFARPEFENEAFPAIREEADARGVAVHDRAQLVMLASVGELIRSLQPPDEAGQAVVQFAPIVTHAFNYWAAGKQSFDIDESALRTLLSGETVVGATDSPPPAAAGYVQLPRNIIFARIAEGAAAEAIDGFFFTGDDALFILGFNPHRAGFSVIDAPRPASAPYGDVKARESDGVDFENVLPGGEGRLLAVTNTMEALKLVARCFWHLQQDG